MIASINQETMIMIEEMIGIGTQDLDQGLEIKITIGIGMIAIVMKGIVKLIIKRDKDKIRIEYQKDNHFINKIQLIISLFQEMIQ